MPASDLQRVWTAELLRLVGWLVLATLVGLAAGCTTLALLIALAIYLAGHLLYAFQLHRWLTADRVEPSDGVGVWRDIYTELHRLKQRNRRRKKRLKNIVSEFQASTAALPDGAVVLDRRGRINWFNDAAAAMLTLQARADRGQRIVNLIRHPRFSSFLAAGHGGDAELEIPSPANDQDTLLIRIVPYGNAQRLLIARDVSNRKRQEITRRDFVANASHELRTPLTVLRGYLEMMGEETDQSKALSAWQQPIAEMHIQSQRMGRIIDSLLRLAQVEGENLAQRQEYIDVPAMLEGQVEDLQNSGEASQEFVFDIDTSLALYGRYSEIESVVSNLVANAARYTPATGQIHVVWCQDDRGACLAVRDNGPGIASEHLHRLTERFYRVDKGRKASDGGTGLGLAIVKHCLEHHESELEVESKLGEGSAFICRFPRQRILSRRAA
ncbi:MAG: phosphate regulon sensor histidine kinase PhoR [Salinisphaera sp.]|nr:phosphate regulon sensor histidine kinase PhoR [Salinisphaera sp.]